MQRKASQRERNTSRSSRVETIHELLRTLESGKNYTNQDIVGLLTQKHEMEEWSIHYVRCTLDQFGCCSKTSHESNPITYSHNPGDICPLPRPGVQLHYMMQTHDRVSEASLQQLVPLTVPTIKKHLRPLACVSWKGLVYKHHLASCREPRYEPSDKLKCMVERISLEDQEVEREGSAEDLQGDGEVGTPNQATQATHFDPGCLWSFPPFPPLPEPKLDLFTRGVSNAIGNVTEVHKKQPRLTLFEVIERFETMVMGAEYVCEAVKTICKDIDEEGGVEEDIKNEAIERLLEQLTHHVECIALRGK